MFKKFLKTVAQAAVPLAIGIAAPQSMINTAIMGGLKNGTPLNNKAIPFINLLGTTAVTYGKSVLMDGMDPVAAIMPAVSAGGLLTAASTGLHQSLKVPIKMRTGRSI